MLRDAMERILGLISKGVLSLEWLIINESDVPKYIAVLNLWLGIKDFETLTKSDMMQGTQDKFSKLEISPGEERNKEAEFYTKLGSLSPHEKILLCRDPLLFRLSKIKHKPETFPDHIRDNWRFNPIVMNHDVHRDTRRSVLWEKFNCGTDPFDALRQLEESKEGQTSLRLFDDTASFFKRTADSLRYLAPRICVEVLCGDVIEIAEWLRFGVSLTRIPRLEKLPTKFDIIYLTHLPDNIGGHLSKLLYLTPLLRSGKTSVVKSQFSHNVVSWDSTSAFLADCQCITDKKMLERLTQVEVVSEPGKDESAPWTRYTWYRPIPPCSKSHWSNFLPRTEFEKWFCGLFFRLALPYNVDIYPQNTIAFSPVNLTILFHLMNYLCSLQYPHHWMAELLLNIIDNTVISTCRPPRMTPVTVSALKQQHDKRHLCTIPFRHEMATLARIFLPMLPFRLETSSLPAQNDIYRYTFPLTSSTRSPAWPLNLTLVFWCDKYLRELGEVGRESLMNNLRPLLDPTWGDEMNSQFKGANFDAFRKAGVIVWSTIELDVQTWTARVWMPRSLVVSMIQKGERHAGSTWRCGLFRTDTWERCWDSPGLVSDAERGERWEDDVASAEELHCRRISKAASRLMHRTF
ncbi:hypothetical protein EYC84_000122 [Monilinia fructicola]|uniref:DUF4470 domain-containing protein n=1 Tax=Monilinia fructicola TaxID=38448 RepID=A0A5M9JPV7_MONFR|nr:hypothetical protein EYC84_000122 [Monilinia fructicola]